MRRVAALFTPLLLLLASAGAQAASDCSLARNEIERDKCYSQNAAESQRNRDAVRSQHESYYRQRAPETNQGVAPWIIQNQIDGERRAAQYEQQKRMEEEAELQAWRAKKEREERLRSEAAFDQWKRNLEKQHAADVVARIEAVKASIVDLGHPTPFEYLRLIDAAFPDRTVALTFAEKALAEWPVDMAFTASLALGTGCIGDKQDTPGNLEACVDDYEISHFDRLAQAAFNGGPVVDRMRFCAMLHSARAQERRYLGWRGKWVQIPPTLRWAKPYFDQCEKGIPEVPARTREGLWDAMAELGQDTTGIANPLNTSWWFERWIFFMHPGWKKLDESGYADFEYARDMIFDARSRCQNRDKRCDELGGIGWQEGYLAPRR